MKDTIGEGLCCSFCHVYKSELNENIYYYVGSVYIKHNGGVGAELDVFDNFRINKGLSDMFKVIPANESDEIPVYLTKRHNFLEEV